MNLALATLLLVAAQCVLCDIYKPPDPYTLNFWTGANESWFAYPETAAGNYAIPTIARRPYVGIALSGGGFRAATLGLGWLRALQQLGVTNYARYLSSNSGGSWLVAAYSFQQKVPVDTFLGPYIPPEQLTLQGLGANSTPGSFAGVIANAGILIPGAVGAVLDAVESLAPGEQQGVGAWSNAVGRAFLEPYGLNSDSSTFTANGTAGPVHQQLRNLPQGVEVYIYTPVVQVAQNGSSGETRPFPVMLGAILQQNTSLGFFPIEFSPLYIGCPSYFNNTNPPIGGGFVDPYGFNSQPPNPKPTIPAPILQAFAATNTSGFDNGTILTQETAANGTTGGTATSQLNALLPLPVTAQVEYLVPLKVVMGISSSFITNTFKPGGVISRELTGTEVLRYWNEIDFTGAEIPFADGGAADNTAITILLRRRVIKIVACIAASQNITGLDATDWAGYQWDISGLFGAAPPTHPSYKPQGTIVGTPVDLYNRKTQVFPKEGYQQLYEAISNTTAAGGPTYHLATYQVLTNGYQGVFGGWEVDVLWVVNQQQTDWEAALPSDTAQALAQGRTQPNGGLGGILSNITQIFQQVFGEGSTSGLENFPLISTGKADYSPGLVTLLSQMAAWQIAQLQPQIQQLLGANATLQTVTPGNASQDAQAGGSSGIPGSQSSTNSAGNYSNRWPVLLEVACTILTAYFAL